MLITILTAGTRGDTQPYIALGVELKKEGHHVRIATFETYESFIKGFGLGFYPVKGDVSMVTAGDTGKAAMDVDNPFKFLLSFNKLQSLAFDMQEDFFNACAESDAIIYHPSAAIGYFVAQQFNIPSILATPIPMTPTRNYPALIFYDKVRLGKTFNRLTHKIFEQSMWSAFNLPIKQFWKKEFGSEPKDFASPYKKQTSRRLPTLTSCSNYVFPRPKDWPEFAYNTGYWFLDEEPDWKPSDELLNFLQRGTPPVYIGFGSMGDPILAKETTELAIHALQRSRQRGILATGWSGMADTHHLPENIFMLDSAPHSWLFPRMAAVVHHGGAGTTAAGLRAGVPSVVIPHGNDQFAWGRRVYELGVGAKPIPRKKLTAENLSDAINVALTNKIKQAAKILGVKIQNEHGIEVAAKIIIDCLKQDSLEEMDLGVDALMAP